MLDACSVSVIRLVVFSSESVKIGRPGYCVTKQYDSDTKQRSLLFQIKYPEIEDFAKPRHRFMSSFEQRVQSFDKRYQYLLFAAEPYEIIGFKIPSTEIDKTTPKFFSHWDQDSKVFTLQLYFKIKPPEANKPPSAPVANGTSVPGAPPRPLPPPPQAPPPPPPPPQGIPPPAPMGNPPRGPPPPPPTYHAWFCTTTSPTHCKWSSTDASRWKPPHSSTTPCWKWYHGELHPGCSNSSATIPQPTSQYGAIDLSGFSV
ncbi:hypothetical protein Scep_005236 [Stephania cephalantha]|uniref:SF3A2 domain-containing protein n=1 Tax=Stephania cephalantha TaxID=152367 RepID=A0AAP0PW65_9MAGN